MITTPERPHMNLLTGWKKTSVIYPYLKNTDGTISKFLDDLKKGESYAIQLFIAEMRIEKQAWFEADVSDCTIVKIYESLDSVTKMLEKTNKILNKGK